MLQVNTIQVKYLRVNIAIEYLITALKFLKRQTRVSSFSDAMTLIHFKDLTKEENEYVAMLVTIWRAWKDGDIEPSVDIEALYSECEI